MKKNRILSFIVVSIVYVFAAVIGVIVYNRLDFHYMINLLIADVVATTVVFIFSLIFRNASVYDPYWSVQPIVIVILFAINNEFTLVRLLVLIAIVLWGVRLTINWGYTFKDLTHQDWRYTMLKEKTKGFYPIVNYLGIHMFPTIVVYLCILPAVYLIKNDNQFNALSVIGFVLALVAVILQLVSDFQMHKFRKNRTSTFIRDGLWKYSRHPNYLGEILMWWSIFIMSILSLDGNYFLIIGTIVNTLMFIFISIPMAENHQASRKPGFSEYKKETRMLLPIKK